MTPKEKAEQLINKFKDPVRWKMGQEDVLHRAKQCALITVDEILHALEYKPMGNHKELSFYDEVKQEIENEKL